MKIYCFKTLKDMESRVGMPKAYHISCSQFNLLITTKKRVKSDQNYHGNAF